MTGTYRLMRRLLVAAFGVWPLLASDPLAAGLVRPVEAGTEVPEGTVLLVGRIEIHPPLLPVEQATLREKYRNKAWIVFDVNPKPITGVRYQSHPGSIDVPLHKTFFVAVPEAIEYYLGALLPMESRAGGDRHATLPGGVRIDIRAEREALYIGTLRYVRNEFFDILRVEIVDEYPAVAPEFAARFGKSAVLRKALLTPHAPPKQPLRPGRKPQAV